MARIFITGSADGLGLIAARLLIDSGHRVVVHGRSEKRAREALASATGAEATVHGDLAQIDEMRSVADQVNALGEFDAVIHNAAVGYRESRRIQTADGLAQLFAINSLSPYVLTALIHKPKRLIYLSSGLHRSGDPSLQDLQWTARRWDSTQAYSDSKLHNAILAFAIARRWSDVLSNALEPGWVATKMGGPGAPDDLDQGAQTQVWLAAGEDPDTRVSGQYFFHKKQRKALPAAHNDQVQQHLLALCEHASGIALPK
jgi:NAD(P)-dependent dehydrogenase (short-subunit alcohol dehydrogenase family)